jgi:16S rRNA (guanine527-N7)-methyltransferase
MPLLPDELRTRTLLAPFGLNLASKQLAQIRIYLELLIRWNEKINLTAIREPNECITRHFGESLFVAGHTCLAGTLLDIGSGAGFPGLALKIAFPDLMVTLLEPVAKKRAFLKEAARACAFDQVEVRSERLEEFLSTPPAHQFDTVTMRAVGNLEVLVPLAAKALKSGGNVLLWLTRDQGLGLNAIASGLTWGEPLAIPLTRSGVICRGTK